MNRTLKDQNAARLITIWALNVFFFLWIFLGWKISEDNWQSLLLGPLGVVLASIVNGLVGSDTKASIVFWRRNHPLPGTRVFSELIKCDNRIDQSKAELQIRGIFNLSPDEQNILWFEYYASVQANPLVISSERGYLFYRDYVSMLVIFSIPALFFGYYYFENEHSTAIYAISMAVQYFAVRPVAIRTGNRFATTVVAVKFAQESKKQSNFARQSNALMSLGDDTKANAGSAQDPNQDIRRSSHNNRFSEKLSTKNKVAAAKRVLNGESVIAVAREIRVYPSRLMEWCRIVRRAQKDTSDRQDKDKRDAED